MVRGYEPSGVPILLDKDTPKIIRKSKIAAQTLLEERGFNVIWISDKEKAEAFTRKRNL